MRELPARLAPARLERRGGAGRELFFFLVAFAAMFGAVNLALDLL
jgi:hypothetical protein